MRTLLTLLIVAFSATVFAQYNGGGRELIEKPVPEFVELNKTGLHLQNSAGFQLGAFALTGAAVLSYRLIESNIVPAVFAFGALVMQVNSVVQLMKAGRSLRTGTELPNERF